VGGTTRGSGALPPQGSLLEIEPPEIILSTVKPAEDDDGVVVRVYNIGSRPIQGRVRLLQPHGRVERVDLNEENPQPVDVRDGGVDLSLRSNEIVTLKFTIGNGK
jgi:alpha-mannosidase